MASRAPKAAASATAGPAPIAQAAAHDPNATPPPTLPLRVTMTTLPKGRELQRVHLDRYGADQFNPGIAGNARFSPIRDQHDALIPTLYAGTTVDCALLESVFHDVPYTPGFKSYDKAKLDAQVHSTLETQVDLNLAELNTVALRKLGVTRKQLIETEKDRYPETRPWAEAIHRECPTVQGLTWVSRQDDTARAFVFFGDRIAPGVLKQKGMSRSLTGDPTAYDEVLNLADRMGVNIVPGKI